MTDDTPKSAYEIALEKLKRQDRERGEQATVPLTSEQKERIAEIRRRHEARLAELEILFSSERGKALASGEPEAIEKVEKEYAQERERVTAQREREVAAARTAAKDDGRDPPPGRKRRGK